ncbi:MAG: precorrin-6y C5,15-methyltransferase (decarboxylating) subunit CbiE [Chloroflexota bacterium]
MRQDNERVSLTVVAIGPGDARLLTLRGQEALQQADLVAGFKTVLEVVRPWLDHAELCPMTYRDQEEVLEYTASQARKGRRCVVCCWGDLNVSARELLARVKARADHVELIPGISSVQVACARAGISLEESLFVTLHQRQDPAADLEELIHYLRESRRHVILLPRPWDLMPAQIASRLLAAGILATRPVIIYQRLALTGEQKWHGTLGECAALSEEFSDLTIILFPRKDLAASSKETA